MRKEIKRKSIRLNKSSRCSPVDIGMNPIHGVYTFLIQEGKWMVSSNITGSTFYLVHNRYLHTRS
jgi:hypothetical protein